MPDTADLPDDSAALHAALLEFAELLAWVHRSASFGLLVAPTTHDAAWAEASPDALRFDNLPSRNGGHPFVASWAVARMDLIAEAIPCPT